MTKEKNILDQYKDKRFTHFFFLNLTLIGVIEFGLIYFNNGDLKNPYPWTSYFTMLFISIIIILTQYPLLNLYSNWYYKTFVFYVSMLLFLFLFGTIESMINLSHKGFQDHISNGLKTIVMGQIFGGLIVFPIVVFFNKVYFNSTTRKVT